MERGGFSRYICCHISYSFTLATLPCYLGRPSKHLFPSFISSITFILHQYLQYPNLHGWWWVWVHILFFIWFEISMTIIFWVLQLGCFSFEQFEWTKFIFSIPILLFENLTLNMNVSLYMYYVWREEQD